MRITHLGATRRGRITLYLDGEYSASLHPSAAGSLRAGLELDEDELDELLRQSGMFSARARALELLSRRAMTSEMLRQRLREKESEEASAAAVERMRELGLLNDGDWALRFAKDCMARRGFSAARTIRELEQKGIDRELARRVTEEQEEDPREAIARIVARKYKNAPDDEKAYRRALSALLRLGYRGGDIRAVIGNLREDEDYYAESGSE
ncbi:MAG: recombination regulator RecX [Oscillospiraceae bacterium]|nr:recombination regulator RecX [Oscillospiraceae bacterium]